jgi:hypothetical protein
MKSVRAAELCNSKQAKEEAEDTNLTVGAATKAARREAPSAPREADRATGASRAAPAEAGPEPWVEAVASGTRKGGGARRRRRWSGRTTRQPAKPKPPPPPPRRPPGWGRGARRETRRQSGRKGGGGSCRQLRCHHRRSRSPGAPCDDDVGLGFRRIAGRRLGFRRRGGRSSEESAD